MRPSKRTLERLRERARLLGEKHTTLAERYLEEWARMPIAKLRYVGSTRLWTLYYHRHTGRWERYPLLGPTRRIDKLVDEIERDPICIFWADEPPGAAESASCRRNPPTTVV
jgi:hypothetical protein